MRTISFQNLVNFSPQSKFEEKVQHFCQSWYSNSNEFHFFTSGSTGEPKEIIIVREQIKNSAQQTISWLGLKENQQALLCLSPDYIAGAMVLVRAMMAKMNLILIEPSQDLSEEITKISDSIHLASFVPNQWKILLNAKVNLNAIFKNAHGVLIGGADLDLATKTKTNIDCQFPVYLTYGMTETVSHIAYQSISQNPTDCLAALPSVKLKQLTNGNLAISSASTLNQWIETNDLVEMLDQTRFRILGRSNRIINSAGLKINPKEIENCLELLFFKLKQEIDFFVAGTPDDFFGEVVSIFVNRKINIDLKEINEYLIQFLDRNKLPKHLFQLDEFIKTNSGKVDILKTLEKRIKSNEIN